MIRLTYSNRTEGLLEAFAADLDAARSDPATGLLDPAFVVVPNRNVEIYVRQGLARLRGIAANLEVHQLRRFVGRLAEAALDGAVLADAGAIRGLLLSVLLDDRRLAEDDLAPVRDWLHAGGDRPEAIDARRVELSGQLARLFEEYAFSRPELLASWPRGTTLAGGPFVEVEAWERRLWLELFGEGGRIARRAEAGGERLVPHAALVERLRSGKAPVPPRVYLFGISYVATLFQRLLAGLAERALVHVYTVNPCLEFWEDVESFRELRRQGLPRRGERRGEAVFSAGPDPFGLSAPGDNPALVSWGRPGRENIRLLNELSECDYRAAFRDPGQGTLLARLQRNILFREPERTAPDPEARADGSIRILAAPGIRREAEVIAQEIWRLVEEDALHPPPDREPLRFHDIAVLVAGSDSEATFTQLAAAFAENHDIPFSLSDTRLAGDSRVAEAIGLLLALPGGRFLRKELLALVTHPAVAGRFPDVEPEEWVAWCDALGIVHGADHEDHRATYLEHDSLNWDQGLRRLALGTFLSGERSGDARLFATGGHRYLPEELEGGDRESAAGFALLVRSLIADARFARSHQLSLPDWADFLVGMVRAYVVPGSAAESNDLERCVRVLAGLAELDLDGRPVSWTVARQLAVEGLSGLGGGRGGYLSSGVAISSLQPMRAIPFRVVFVAGLTEGRFPAGDRKHGLDLRQAAPRAGDVSPREGDRYLFLETLLSARDRLYLSYVSREGLTGERLQPSSVVIELVRILEGLLGPDAEALLTEEHPLRRHDPGYFPRLFGTAGETPGEPERRNLPRLFAEAGRDAPAAPEARREAQALALREELTAVIGERRIDLRLLGRVLPPDTLAAIRERLGVLPVPVEPARAPETLRVSLSAIRKFLECPLQGGAAFLLRLEEAEEGDVLATEDEPFALSRLEVAGQLRRWFLASFAAAGAIPSDEALAEQARQGEERLALAGRGPSGVFAEVELRAHHASLAGWAGHLREVDAGAPVPRVLRFGPADEHEEVDRVEAPIVLDVATGSGTVRVEVVGRTEPLLGEATSLTLVRRGVRKTRSWEAVRQHREALRGFLDHVALSAAGIAEGEHRVLLINGAPGAPRAELGFAPLPRDEARAWLGEIVADMLEVHPTFLPCELAFYMDLEGVDLAAAVEALSAEKSHASAYGPVSRPERYDVPSEAEAEASFERRFGLFRRLRRGA